MKTSEIRTRYLDFFAGKGHAVVKSDSLIPSGDPSLLFTGAGMNQFKDYFLGVKKDLRRACSSQKCLRTGDLDRVGQTPYHLSFFEMLGNFSFGDYFKKEAIEWAWEFLTKELKIAPEKLRVSVHKTDQEAYDIWRKHIEIREDFIKKLDDDTNFWPANAPKNGPNGPCGPCSEIFFDQGEGYQNAQHSLPWYQDQSGRFAEIWNLVFTQFDRQDGGSLKPLASKNIDTGSGLERVACILQGKQTNFEIDLFQPLIHAIRPYLKVSRSELGILYAIVDHGRAVTFAISDGAFPSNEGRGYVIRKLIRRSIWRAQTLGVQEPFLEKIVPAVIGVMGDAYPELKQSEKSISQTIRQEEERFLETLEKGLLALSKLIEKAKNDSNRVLFGEDVFLLYDTYGFPDELTRIIAAKEDLQIDQKSFDSLMAKQRQRAKEKSKISNSIFSIDEAKKEISHLPETKFLGYETLESEGNLLWFKESGEEALVVLDQTPFYPEGGGQVGDRGMVSGVNFEMAVLDTQKREKIIVHIGKIIKGTPQSKMKVKTKVDQTRRDAAKRNHTATHLLQAALRQILGTHVRQVGSLVNSEKLRFDFSHGKALTKEEIGKIEQMVNAVIVENREIQAKQLSFENAAKEGAIAFFGDKYGETVRVIDVPGFSKELCGGTHCKRTGDIGQLIITSESAIASGTRRIEALTGLGALDYLQHLRKQMKTAAELLKTAPDQLVERIEKMQNSAKQVEKENKSTGSKGARIDLEKLIQSARSVKDISFISGVFENSEMGELRKVCDTIKKRQLKRTVTALFGVADQKVGLVVSLGKDLENSRLNAGELVKEMSQICQGSGGGKKELAQGGGKNPERIEEAIRRAVDLIQEGLN